MANFKNEEIKSMCNNMVELINEGHVIVKHEDVDKIVNLGSFFGLIIFGGAFIEDDKQCLYID